MHRLGLSKKHGGITTPLVLYILLGFLLFTVPPAMAMSGADEVFNITQIGSFSAANEIPSYFEQYQDTTSFEDGSINNQIPRQYSDKVQRPEVSVADSFGLPDTINEESITDYWQSDGYNLISLGHIPHSAIYIDEDSDFAGQGWPGSGIEGSPYLIENLLIDIGGVGSFCILIQNTQVYFIIRNCTIVGASTTNAVGIYFNNVKNGRLENCDFYNNYDSIYIYESSDCSVYDCYFGDSFHSGMIHYSSTTIVEQCTFSELSPGFSIQYSDNIDLLNCSFYGTPGIGSSDTALSIFYADYSTIENCKFLNYDDPGTESILVGYGLHNTISYCNFTNNYCGLYFEGENSEASYNYFKNNTMAGILLFGSDLVVHDNTFYRNGQSGLSVYGAQDCIIENNTITETTGIGIGGSDLSVTGSTFSNNTCVNNGYGIVLAGDGTGNTFSGNNCSYNTFDGIYLENCDSNTLTDNICRSNGRHGIVLFTSANMNTLSSNDCSYNQVGILLEYNSNENTLELNDCSFCMVYAICLLDSSHNEISSNTCNDSSFDGISVQDLSEANELLDNTCNNNVGFGVYVNGTGSNTIDDGEYSYNLYGIYLDWTFSNIISFCLCEYNDIGIFIVNDYDDALNELSDNNCNHNFDNGITLVESLENTLDHNYCSYNGAGIVLFYAPANDLMNNTCSSNTLYGIYSLYAYAGWLIDNDCSDNPYGIWIEDSNSVTMQENILTGCTIGISVLDSSTPYIIDNTCTGNNIGVSITGVSTYGYGGGQVRYTHCSNNTQYGIYLDGADETTVHYNEINYNGIAGVYIINADEDEVIFNTIDENQYGVYVESGTSNMVGDNWIINNLITGVHIGSAPINSFMHHNNLVDNFRNAIDDGITSLIVFNFWSNYTGEDMDSNGIGDTPHNVTGAANNSDPYPLVFYSGAPVFIVTPTDQTVEYGDTFTYDLDATSYSPLKEWSIDDTEHFSINNKGVITNIVPLDFHINEPGEYPLEVSVENIYNYTTHATFTVRCQDTVSPTLEGPDDYSFVEGTLGHTLRWNASDLTLEEYGIYVYNPEGYILDDYYGFFNHTADFIEINIDGLSVGVYNFSIWVQDRAYNHAFDYVIVTVTSATGGYIFISPELLLIGAGTFGVIIVIVIAYTILKRRNP